MERLRTLRGASGAGLTNKPSRSAYREVLQILDAHHGDAKSIVKGTNTSPNEQWLIREQYFKALVESGAFKHAQIVLNELVNRFGTKGGKESQRITMLKAMLYEAQGKYKEADDIYIAMEIANPSNFLVLKRRIALERSKGDSAAAARLLNKYLDVNQADVEAWMEMADLQMCEGQFKPAAYCLEEALLAHPYNHAMHTLYGEVLYSISTSPEQILTARSYFAQSLVLKPADNARACWGLLMCSFQSKDEVGRDLARKSASELKKIYSSSSLSQTLKPLIAVYLRVVNKLETESNLIISSSSLIDDKTNSNHNSTTTSPAPTPPTGENENNKATTSS
jgi:tetratricopeptide (TPR) repeat protein